MKIQKEQDGVSKGYGFIEFKTSDLAENAMKHLNGFELAGQPIRVNYVNERSDAMETLDSEDMDIGIGMSASSRASLMAKLSEGHNAGTYVCTVHTVHAYIYTYVNTCVFTIIRHTYVFVGSVFVHVCIMVQEVNVKCHFDIRMDRLSLVCPTANTYRHGIQTFRHTDVHTHTPMYVCECT